MMYIVFYTMYLWKIFIDISKRFVMKINLVMQVDDMLADFQTKVKTHNSVLKMVQIYVAHMTKMSMG